MSLAKTPLILLLTFAFHASFTAPNPPPAKDDLVPTSKMDWVLARSFMLKILRLGQNLLAAAEIITIIFHTIPSSAISQATLSICFFKGKDPNRLQLYPLGYLAAFLWMCGYALRLVTTGSYAYVRHPSYSGIILADFGWGLWHGKSGSWVRESAFLDSAGGTIVAAFIVVFMLGSPVFTLSRISQEDRALRRKFGKGWNAWASKVHYLLILGIY